MSKQATYSHLTVAAVTLFAVCWAIWALAYQVSAEVERMEFDPQPELGPATVVSR